MGNIDIAYSLCSLQTSNFVILAVNPCQLPLDVGRGASALPRYYFNQLSKKCQQFSYSGQGGNANNFINIESCRRSCPGKLLEFLAVGLIYKRRTMLLNNNVGNKNFLIFICV